MFSNQFFWNFDNLFKMLVSKFFQQSECNEWEDCLELLGETCEEDLDMEKAETKTIGQQDPSHLVNVITLL